MDTTSHTQPFSPDSPKPNAITNAARVQARRDLFWTNVVRDTLMAMSSAAAASSARLAPTPSAAEHSTSPVASIFDGRMGIVTALGQRIAIADIFPVFACSTVSENQQDRDRSADVQCSVFRITTPNGETYTLPISQIVAVHSISEELIRQIESQSQRMQEAKSNEPDLPFGFAAYTELARAEAESKSNSNPNA